MISVVIPTYNQAHFLARAVESVWAQHVPDVEIVIVDDGSTDDTEAVLSSLSLKGPVSWCRQPNLGPAAARNCGIRHSRGDWVAFLDADDYWLPSKLEQQLHVLQEGANEFAYCGTVITDDSGTVISKHPALIRQSLASELVWGNFISTPTVIASKVLLQDSGLFDETLRLGEDWDLWLRLAIKGRGRCIPEPLVAVRYSDWFARDYHLQAYEVAIPQILDRFFALLNGSEKWAHLIRRRPQVMSRHYSMLAKAHLRHHNWKSFFRYARLCIGHSPQGFSYLLPTWSSPRL